MKKIYALPIRLEIDSTNPDRYARRIAEIIHDAVEQFSIHEFHGSWIDMEYSIYIKAEEGDFGNA